MLAHEILLGDEAEQVGAEILGSLGIAYDAETAAAVRATQEALTSVGPNLVQMLAEGRIARDEARPYARRWLLGPELLVDRSVALLDWPWPAYALCYPAGLALARRFVNGDPVRFRRLLDEQLTPQDLTA
jgi:hypothetical protein